MKSPKQVLAICCYWTISFTVGCRDGMRLKRFDRDLLDASASGDTNRVLHLLAIGAKPNIASSEGRHLTPLLWAAYEEHWNTCVILLKNGADPNCRETGIGTVLSYLVEGGVGSTNVVALALQLGAKPGYETNHFREMRELEPIKMLYEKYSQSNLNSAR